MMATPIRLGPGDQIATRSMCWRPACRERFGPYRTVAHLQGGRVVVAWCHRTIHDAAAYQVDVWKYGEATS